MSIDKSPIRVPRQFRISPFMGKSKPAWLLDYLHTPPQLFAYSPKTQDITTIAMSSGRYRLANTTSHICQADDRSLNYPCPNFFVCLSGAWFIVLVYSS